jgi:NAD dependent epimerase/dehydratase family enzyme
MAALGFGGKQGPGNQYCSWIHENDFVSVIDYLIDHEHMYGVYNVTAPVPISNRHLMKVLCSTIGIPFGIPMTKWILELGAALIGTETELILKSRRVIPKRLIEEGFGFNYPTIEEALTDLLKK